MSTETILGKAPAPLGLRIRGTDRDGQVVWLQSPKVTIGSGNTSTLRLRAAGVAPLHCIILRGSERIVARCWSPDTRCNGKAFQEAALAVGDRLGVGPLELEVVEKLAEGGRRKAEGAKEADSLCDRQIEQSSLKLETAAGESQDVQDAATVRKVRRLAARFKLSRRQARRRIQKLTDELRTARFRAADLESQLAQQRNEAARYESRQAEWEQQRRAIDAERQQWLQTQAHIEQLLAELDRRSEVAAVSSTPATLLASAEPSTALEQEAAALRSQLNAERQAWDSQRAAWETELSERQAALRQESDQLQRLQGNVQRQQSLLEGQLESLSQRQKQLESRGDEISRNQQAAEDQRRILRLEIEKLDNERSQFAAQREGFGKQQEAFEKDRLELDQGRAELADSSSKLQARQAELDAQLQAWEVERREFESQRSETGNVAEQRRRLAEELQTLGATQEELQRQQQELAETQRQIAQAREELLQTRQDWEAEVARQSAARSQPRQIALPSQFAPATAARQEEKVPIERPAQVGSNEEQYIAPPDDSRPEESELLEHEPSGVESKSGESDEVFARLRALDILKSGGDQRHEESPVVEATTESETIEEPKEKSSSQEAAPPSTVEGSESEDEESIETYMARLLQRVGRGPATSQDAGSQSAKPKSAAVLQPASDAPTRPSTETAAPMRALSELEPRSAAPEKTRDLAAMREIANFTARTAIAKHAWRSRAVILLKRFMLGIVALVCGAILILLAPTMSSHYFLCGLAAITAALLWFLPAIYRARKCNKQAQNAQQQATADYETSPPEED